jgi:hypothetical protein
MRLARSTGRLPELAEEPAISAAFYREIARLCRESGARLVVVVLEAPEKQDLSPAHLALPEDVVLVDTKPGLYARLPAADRRTYLRAYGHWRGRPPRLVDEHPNARAHAVIAEQVLAALGR